MDDASTQPAVSVPVGGRVLIEHMVGGGADYYAVLGVGVDGTLSVLDSNSLDGTSGVGGAVVVDPSAMWLDWSFTSPDGSLSVPWNGRGEAGVAGSWLVVEASSVRPNDVGANYGVIVLASLILGVLLWWLMRAGFRSTSGTF